MQAKTFTVDKFLGINEGADGQTELKMGQAAQMENFYISDGYNLVTRGGARRITHEEDRENAPVLALWAGNVEGTDMMVAVDFLETDRIWIYTARGGVISWLKTQQGALGLTFPEDAKVKIFPFAGRLFIMSAGNTLRWNGEEFVPADIYVPLVITGASPAGGGTALENLNLLTGQRRITFNGDGESREYIFPEEAAAVSSVMVDNQTPAENAGIFDPETHCYTFTEAPAQGIGNVEFTYEINPEQAEKDRLRVVNMTLAENYNGQTDTRLFLAGDGTNICIYSGVPMSGDITQLYFPAMNEVAMDMAAGPVTGIVRSDCRLLVFTRSGADLITYEPVTLEDGTTTAGFYLRNGNRKFGNEALGQVQVTRNKARTVSDGGVYEWNFSSFYARDERHAKRVSDSVERSLRNADLTRAVTLDDNFDQTYYLFLNDGRILLNRYALEGDIWCVYKSRLFQNVRFAAMLGSVPVFATNSGIFQLTTWAAMDDAQEIGGEELPITAEWESGYMDFGTDYRLKHSSNIYVSILPQSRSRLAVTASTDRRSAYPGKAISSNVFSYGNISYRQWSYNMLSTPKIRRVRLKVKKFVYYKLIFRVDEPGTRATVLSFDQEVRFASRVK